MFDLMWRVMEKGSSGTAMHLTGRWWCPAKTWTSRRETGLLPREGLEDRVKVRRRGQVLSNDEFWFGNIMHLVACQTSEGDWLVS